MADLTSQAEHLLLLIDDFIDEHAAPILKGALGGKGTERDPYSTPSGHLATIRELARDLAEQASKRE